MNPKGRPKAEWQRSILKLKDRKNKEISLSQLEKMTEIDKVYLAQSISRMVKGSRKETYYNTQELYEAVRNKLQDD